MTPSPSAPSPPPSQNHPSPKPICSSLTAIPLPADDYDRIHSTYAALSSLHAATSAFDAAMDSLAATTAHHQTRIRKLELRAARCREWIAALSEMATSKGKSGGGEDVDDMLCAVLCPSSYEAALEGIEMDLSKVRSQVENVKIPSKTGEARSRKRQEAGDLSRLSAAEAARSAADAAVRDALVLDAQTDDGEALPSDAWLDSASVGLGVGRALKVAEGQRRVPLLLGSVLGNFAAVDGGCMGEAEYQAILDSMLPSGGSFTTGAAIPASLAGLSGGPASGMNSSFTMAGGGDDESVHSTTSRMSALSVTSTPVPTSGRMTAAQRRRWHQQQQQRRQITSGAATAAPLSETTNTSMTASTSAAISETAASAAIPNTATTTASTVRTPAIPPPYLPHPSHYAIAGRQQSYTGSQPFLCEILHDYYGIGSQPPKGLLDCSGFSARGTREGGTQFYPPPSSFADLVVFNTTRGSYGLAERRAAAAAAAAAGGGGGGGPASASTPSPPVTKTTTESVKAPSNPTSSPVAVNKRTGSGGIETATSSLAKLVFVPDASAVSTGPKKLDLPESLPLGS